jgi:hypothetical protein
VHTADGVERPGRGTRYSETLALRAHDFALTALELGGGLERLAAERSPISRFASWAPFDTSAGAPSARAGQGRRAPTTGFAPSDEIPKDHRGGGARRHPQPPKPVAVKMRDRLSTAPMNGRRSSE